MQANRMADALLIADLAGRDDLTRVQQLYMKRQPSPYMRVVKAIQGNDFVSKYLGQHASWPQTSVDCPYLQFLHLGFGIIETEVTMLCHKLAHHKLAQCATARLYNAIGQGSTGGSAFSRYGV